jgi:hypothetical protein
MRKFLAAACLAIAASAASAQTTDQSIQLQFHEDGTVTLSARNATTSDILLAWANECECVVVNGNRLSGPALTTPILFEKAPQAVVLRSLLRQAGGFVLTPRRPGAKGPSQYETIYILPTSTAAAAPFPVTSNPTSFQPVRPPTMGAPDDEIPPVTPIRIPEPVDPAGDANSPNEPAGPTRNPPTPGVSLPGVRVVPIMPIGTSPAPAGSTQPTAPGGVTPARTP